SKIKFCIFYETAIRLGKGTAPVDFNDEATRALFLSDMLYLAKTYFGNPSYFNISGRPVISIYIARAFRGEFAPVLQQVRQQISGLGFSLYLIGDALAYGRNDFYTISRFDAVT